MRESVYLETTVVSYYTAKPSRDIIILAHQEITRQWWDYAKERYDIYISQVVLEEAGYGDPQAASKRLQEISGFPHLELSELVERMARTYLENLPIPKTSFRDATHLAVAAVHDIDYLVTWNCSHLANAEMIKRLVTLNKTCGVHTPVICTPEELMEVRP